MENEKNTFIFREMIAEQPFVDRYAQDDTNAVDVIITIVHSNALWRNNLISFYREIPIRRLLIGDGGCKDDSIKIVQEFPRVEVLDHSMHFSQGYSIRLLIEAVKTEWFIYLHSDVYLPSGWFEKMLRYQNQYDWFECRQHITAMIDYPLDTSIDRSYSGSQMGKKSAFEKVLPKIDDDFLFRNEDIIISSLVEETGHRFGRVDDIVHYHQTMNFRGESIRPRVFKNVTYEIEKPPEEDVHEYFTYIKGLIKYINHPKPYMVVSVKFCIDELRALGAFDWPAFKAWVTDNNPLWLDYLGPLDDEDLPPEPEPSWAKKLLIGVKKGIFNMLRGIAKLFFKDLMS